MAKRVIDSAIETHLVNNEPFEYAHLVKFERPFHPSDGKFRTNANRYVYLTDAERDNVFEGNTYKAHQLLTIGNYSETTQAKATNLKEFEGPQFLHVITKKGAGLDSAEADRIGFHAIGKINAIKDKKIKQKNIKIYLVNGL